MKVGPEALHCTAAEELVGGYLLRALVLQGGQQVLHRACPARQLCTDLPELLHSLRVRRTAALLGRKVDLHMAEQKITGNALMTAEQRVH